ncbi:tRNA dimethylallyltransferase [Peptoclostridium litorale DSM 5388]|uniref:tRNA dimethylallyltransferase n=1 Tax=Peptoclostridium litorale DSM 5388 TaxID=1121324 RepID=A0A069RGF5_PEPLI|nr:tRNA (adenosine(37)-N6)-dimethylallyltransferase MiaA [Peptoclostridium litorale]KDR95250.1 tRNA dimethylallyltransferase MiaA [Peptoclostridium litorale DSM 5388]SIN72734.1 tRNA dimethylallyltransferase [Peptoclostridium litorale DSM 5388]
MGKIPLIIIAGPTAVGKTDLSIKLAHKYNTSIISADSMQIYRHMDKGTAKPSIEEMDGVNHYMIDVVEPSEDFSVAEFCRLAEGYIEDIHSNGHIPIVAGGTGLYINSLLYDMDFSSSQSNEKLRKELRDFANEHGPEKLHEKLRAVSPENADNIHPNNVKRVIRALEIYYETGNEKKDFASAPKPSTKYDPILIVLNRDREHLYSRINKRVDIMMEDGLLDEVRQLLEMGCTQNMISMRGIGYKEIICHLEGLYFLEEAVEEVKLNSRRYAKRQLTWFRRYDFAKWFNIDEFDDYSALEKSVIDYIEHMLSNR